MAFLGSAVLKCEERGALLAASMDGTYDPTQRLHSMLQSNCSRLNTWIVIQRLNVIDAKSVYETLSFQWKAELFLHLGIGGLKPLEKGSFCKLVGHLT